MKLHIGNYLWMDLDTREPRATYPKLKQDLTCDCLIIGGGIGGALCAHLLHQQGLSVILCEQNTIGTGSTLVNTGLIQYANDKSLTSFIHTLGEQKAVHFYRACRSALEHLKEINQSLNLHVLETRPSIYLASSEEDVPILYEEYTTLQKYGFPAAWLDADQIRSKFPFQRPAAIYTKGDAEIQPVDFTRGLVSHAASKGVQVFEYSPVQIGSFRPDGVSCRCGASTIKAKRVIFATGYMAQTLKREPGAELVTSYAIATDPAPHLNDWYERCLIWETARPYLYMRTASDGSIIIGGLDEPLPSGGLKEGREIQKGKDLLHLLHQMFPEKSPLQIKRSWGAVFGRTRDGLPFIGGHPDFPHCYFLEGYGGNGTVCSMLGAELIADLIMGISREDAEMFSLTRSTRPVPSS
ncbi:oxidoreductase [Paenibacillus antibioticophila]|uniref:Oxidoreductase n=1 Tax=Paenibacillus antibioticophila TaxID=1274374 RepID=A0A919XY97_9BACL|nr:FAD-dependent oxidoreductase [Paenibacillus antibioticophila]GIO38570.1 oxidoreductase [Paenibacillus antibioticophila]